MLRSSARGVLCPNWHLPGTPGVAAASQGVFPQPLLMRGLRKFGSPYSVVVKSLSNPMGGYQYGFYGGSGEEGGRFTNSPYY